MLRFAAPLFLLLVIASAAQATPSQSAAGRSPAVETANGASASSASATTPSDGDAANADRNTALTVKQPSTTHRSLLPLYISFGALQALDVHSTLRAIDRGAVEGNVLVQPFAGRPAAFIAIKAGLTAGLILANRSLSRRHRVAAFAVMVAASGAYAAVVAHNYRVAASLGGR